MRRTLCQPVPRARRSDRALEDTPPNPAALPVVPWVPAHLHLHQETTQDRAGREGHADCRTVLPCASHTSHSLMKQAVPAAGLSGGGGQQSQLTRSAAPRRASVWAGQPLRVAGVQASPPCAGLLNLSTADMWGLK